ncbi:MAG: glycosyltransferase [Betaproteobacteria bacterium]|nr:glycosyltransferase [Betaproteobacteria bacterium]
MRLVIDMQGAQSASSRYRGIGRYTLALTQAMVRHRGEHEIILCLSGLFSDSIAAIRETFEQQLPPENIQVWQAPGPVNVRNQDNAERRRNAAIIRENFLASLKPDMVLVSSLFEGLDNDAVTSIGATAGNIPTASILYDLIPLVHRQRYLAEPITCAWYEERLVHLCRADLLLSISEASRRECLEHLNLSPDRVVNISTAADPHFRPVQISDQQQAELRERYQLLRPFALYTGSIVEYRKNIDGLIRAYARLPADMRKNHQLVIVCSLQGNIRAELEALGQAHALQPGELVLTGFVPEEDLLVLYNLCKVFVFPSWHEGFGLPALEAMSCGRAVIGANNSSVPEVVGRTDALFDPHDDAAIAAKLEQVLGDDAFRCALETYGLQQARCFSWDRTAKTALAAIEDWLSRQAAVAREDKFESVPAYTCADMDMARLEMPAQPDRGTKMSWIGQLPGRIMGLFDAGLTWRQRMRRIPVLGRVFAWCHAFLLMDITRRQAALGLDELRDRMQRMEQRLIRIEALRIEERLRLLDEINIAYRLNQLDQMNISQRLNQLDQMNIAHRLNSLDEMNIAGRLNGLDQMNIAQRLNHLEQMKTDVRLKQIEDINADQRLAALEELKALNLGHRMNSMEAMYIGYRLNRLDALDIANRLHVLDLTNIAHRLNRLESTLPQQNRENSGGDAHAAQTNLDGFYLDFENAFRGDYQDIQNRFAVYLPYLADVANNAEVPVVDLGCGRGEWLELLVKLGMTATGIDSNPAMVAACRQRGLAAECTGALGFLKNQQPGSLGAITGFHFIEHLPFQELIALCDAALAALRPGGLLIFETPNPENLAVGARSFYFDPTHNRPIIPKVAEFILRQRGFARTEILPLHPYPDDHQVNEDSEAARRLNQLFYSEQDYAVLAWKAHAD